MSKMSVTMESLQFPVQNLRDNLQTGVLEKLESRKDTLKRLYDLLVCKERELIDSIRVDFKKPEQELRIEFMVAINQLVHAYRNVSEWMKPGYVSKSTMQMLDTAYYTYEPHGLVYILSTWNYPISLTLNPLAGAISAGNAVILRLPDALPEFSKRFQEFITEFKLGNCIFTSCLKNEDLLQSFEAISPDFVFFTGSTSTAKDIVKACGEKLTPFALELGGKCPVYVDESFDLARAARLICSARFFNAGQTCIAVDYVLCSDKIRDELITQIQRCISEFYGKEIKSNPHYGRIINQYHTRRLVNMLSKTSGNVVIGGGNDLDDNYIEPTVVSDIVPSDSLMQSEIFGPILPIIAVSNHMEALWIIRSLAPPLTIMLFTYDKSLMEFFRKNSRSGSLVVNESFKHMSICDLPFGGVGASGVGRYHGFHGFECFSYKRSQFVKGPFYSISDSLIYPPFTPEKEKKLDFWGKEKLKTFSCLPVFLPTVILAGLAAFRIFWGYS